MKYSTIIKNGTILDGTGSRSFQGDIAIEKEKIARIGDLREEKAGLVIDASQLYIAPGFIDLTTHSDKYWTIFSQPKQESFIRQGVTTIVGGHGGSSLAPVINKDSIQALEKWIDTTEININWQTMEEFLNQIKNNLTINFATFVGHETLRRNALNNEARPANKEEINVMNSLLEKALKEGAFGLSTNFGTLHGQAAPQEELLSLFKTTAGSNSITAHHLENEGKNLLPALSRLITLLRSSGAKGHIAHFKALGRTAWNNFEDALKMIELARKENTPLTCDFFPYTSTGSNLSSLLPLWILSESKEKIPELLKEKRARQNLIEHFKSITLHYDKIIIASTARNTGSVGKSIRKISQDSGLSEEEVIIDLLKTNDMRVSIFNNVILEKNIEVLSRKPYSMIASDGVGYTISPQNQKQVSVRGKNLKLGLPHPRSFGAFPRVFANLVKEKNILTWEEAVYKMSGLPAETLGIKNRGVLEKQNYADIVVFDPKLIKDKAAHNNPFQYPEGVQFVFVNGVLTFAENKLIGKGSGKVLKKNGD